MTTITYPLSFPLSNIQRIRIDPIVLVAASESEFSGAQQLQRHPGEWWQAEISLAIMERANAEEWFSFFLKLRGRYGTFLFGDPAGATGRGSLGGTPLLDGAHSARAEYVDLKGLGNNVTNWARKGDYFQLGSGSTARLHKFLDDVSSDGSGEAADVPIFPFLRTSYADNAPLTVSSAKGVFRLADNNLSFDIDEAVHYGKSFAIREAI